jgi:hypothetical protein
VWIVTHASSDGPSRYKVLAWTKAEAIQVARAEKRLSGIG